MTKLTEEMLARLELEHPNGVTSAEILEFFSGPQGIAEFFEQQGWKFSEATLRKYVQLGLLPRSVRIGRKGKHTGSQGVYPVTIVRQIVLIKEMMAQNLTIEEIQREFLFVRGDMEELEKRLSKIFKTLRDTLKKQRSETSARSVGAELGAAEDLARDLVARLGKLEERLTTQARLARRKTG